MTQETDTHKCNCPICQNTILIPVQDEEAVGTCQCGCSVTIPAFKGTPSKPKAANPSGSAAKHTGSQLSSNSQPHAEILEDPAYPGSSSSRLLRKLEEPPDGMSGAEKRIKSAQKETIGVLADSAAKKRGDQKESQADFDRQIVKITQAQNAQVAAVGQAFETAAGKAQSNFSKQLVEIVQAQDALVKAVEQSAKVVTAKYQEEFANQLSTIAKAQESQVEKIGETARKVADTIVGDARLSRLEDRFAAMLKQAFDQGLGEERELKIDDVLEVFDIFDRFRQFWKCGDDLTAEEAESKPQVVVTLDEVYARMERWAARHRLTPFPDLASGLIPYDVESHRRVETLKTADAALDGMLARVDLVGYSWKGRRLRQADVAVYKLMKNPSSVEPSGHE
jgi:hypothetical protein